MNQNLKKYRGASLWEDGKNIIADVYIAADVNNTIYEYEKRIKELEANLPIWHKVSDGDMPKTEGLYDIAVRNKNMDCGIWLSDVAFFDGEKWEKRFFGTWEDIVMWKEREIPQTQKNVYETRIKELEEEKKRLSEAYDEIRDDWAADERILIKVRDAMKEYRE